MKTQFDKKNKKKKRNYSSKRGRSKNYSAQSRKINRDFQVNSNFGNFNNSYKMNNYSNHNNYNDHNNYNNYSNYNNSNNQNSNNNRNNKKNNKKNFTYAQYNNNSSNNSYNNSDNKQYLNIWDSRSTKIDRNSEIDRSRVIILIILDLLLIFLGNLSSIDQIGIIIIISINSALFVWIFIGDYDFSGIIPGIGSGKRLQEIKPFNNMSFFFNDGEKDSIFVKNLNERRITGLFSIRVEKVPTNVEGNITAMLRSLYEYGIKFTYQFIYQPEIGGIEQNNEDLSNEEASEKILKNIGHLNKLKGSRDISNLKKKKIQNIPTDEQQAHNYSMDILFNFYAEKQFWFDIDSAITELQGELNSYHAIAQTLIAQNFSHFQFKRLKGDILVSSLQTGFSKTVSQIKPDIFSLDPENEDIKELGKKILEYGLNHIPITVIKKIVYGFFFLLIGNLFFSLIPSTQKYWIFMNSIGIIILISFIVSEYLIIAKFFGEDSNRAFDRSFINPFEGVKFYKYEDAPGILFLFIDSLDIMIGLKFWAINGLSPFFNFSFSKFLRACTGISPKLPFSYTQINNPCDIHGFNNDYLGDLNQKQHYFIKDQTGDVDFSKLEQWMDFRGGMFETIHLFKLSAFIRIEEPSISIMACDVLKKRLNNQSVRFDSAVRSSLKKASLYDIQDFKSSIRALIINTLRGEIYFKKGSNLPKLPLQTKLLADFIKIDGEVKKGVKVQLPAEFITPTGLFSAVDFAYLYNTHVSKRESRTGLQIEQLFNGVAIAGDVPKINDFWVLGILINALKKRIPFITFDFDGIYSSLYGVFNNTQVQENILFLKLGKNFSMNIFSSENPNRIEESTYLNRISDCFEIAYNLTNTESMILKKLMMISTPSIDHELDIVEVGEGLNSLRNSFSRDSLESINTILERLHYDRNINAFRTRSIEMISFSEIIFSNKTIILDLSELDLQEKILAQMVFLVKMFHFTNMYKNTDFNVLSGNINEENQDYEKFEKLNKVRSKVLILNEPTELLTKAFQMRIDPFIKFRNILISLKSSGYGVILKCENISRIVDNIQTICSSYIGLKTTNYYDKHALNALLQLDLETEGFSKFRKISYQGKFLEKLPKSMAIIKRDDNDFPFAIELDLKPLSSLRIPEENEIEEHMKGRGYDSKIIENSIIKTAAKTNLEKDFGKFVSIISPIIGFFKEMTEISKVNNDVGLSGITKQKCLLILKNFIHEPLLHIFGNDKVAREMRKEILDIMIQYNYLIVSYNSGFDGSANATPLYRISDKVDSSIKEYYESNALRKATSKINYIDEDGEEIDEINGIDDYSDIGNYFDESNKKKDDDFISSEFDAVTKKNVINEDNNFHDSPETPLNIKKSSIYLPNDKFMNLIYKDLVKEGIIQPGNTLMKKKKEQKKEERIKRND